MTIRRRPPAGIDRQPCVVVVLRTTTTPLFVTDAVQWISKCPPRTATSQPTSSRRLSGARCVQQAPNTHTHTELVRYKNVEVDKMREQASLSIVMQQAAMAPPSRDFIGALESAASTSGRPGLIAEVKKASPSKGVIQPDFDHVKVRHVYHHLPRLACTQHPTQIAKAYEEGGASCLSVLTDSKFFQGSFQYLQDIRAAGVTCPLLCKEFVIEAYQLFKARASGADAVLLIAAVLPNSDLEYLIKCARNIKLQCLIEVRQVGTCLVWPTMYNHRCTRWPSWSAC